MRQTKVPKEAKFIDRLKSNSAQKKGYKRIKRYPYKLYVPENLDLEQIFGSFPPPFHYYLDYFIYILHLIISIPARLKDYDIERQKGFTPINKTLISKRIHNYRRYIDFLKQLEIVEEGTSYLAGYYSTGLKYTPRYRTKIKGVYITRNTLIKSITKSSSNRDVEAENKLHFLKQWFNNKLTIDKVKAVEYLELDKELTRELYERKRSDQRRSKYYVSIDDIVTLGYNMKYIVVDRIHEGKNHSLTVDRTSGRFHSPLTQLKKELRQYVQYDGEKLWAVDIINSQPLLSLIVLDYELFMKNKIYQILSYYNPIHHELLNLDKLSILYSPTSTMLVNLLKKSHKLKDVQNFKKSVIDGNFYEFFGELLLEKNLVPSDISNSPEKIRKYAKTAIFTAFFSRVKDSRWNLQIKAFRKCFPNVARIFDLVKAGTNSHAALACLLQRFESNLVLHMTSVEINESCPSMPVFTIHDSIATTEQFLPHAERIFKKNLCQCLGIEPKFHIEKW